MIFYGVGFGFSLEAYDYLSLQETHIEGLRAQVIGLFLEGIALWWMWSLFFTLRYPIALREQLTFPLAISLFGLPWEVLLRGVDVHLQQICTDIAVRVIDLLDGLMSLNMHVKYWDSYTFYSEEFYLIVNETCSGVNLLISMSLYAVGFSWVMKCRAHRAITLVIYILPLCLLFNGFRIVIIFFLGHYGGRELAMGSWHEGSAYICQIPLFLLLAWIHHILERGETDRSRELSKS
jgi:exosortase/archaeosortase family protein